jgi:hypothetical protein
MSSMAIGFLGLALTACASSSVLVGNARQAIDPKDVKIYLEAPTKYETVALLEASDIDANGFSAQIRINKVMKRLKSEAAELGANGILLQGIDTQYTGSIGSGIANATINGNRAFVSGFGYSAAQHSKVGRAIAIYVPAGDTTATITSPIPEEHQNPAPERRQLAPHGNVQKSPETTPHTPKSGTKSNWREWGKN